MLDSLSGEVAGSANWIVAAKVIGYMPNSFT